VAAALAVLATSATSVTGITADRRASAAATAATSTAELRGPIEGGTHGFPFTSSAIDLAAPGYTEREYFATGRAQAYRAKGTWGKDGKWAVAPTTTAPYTTRLLVRRPTDRSKFNGTVIVEWLNVSSGADIDVDFGFTGEELLRRGYAWVGVSAQAAGVTGTGGGAGLSLGPDTTGLRSWDPPRYAALDHPGDAYSYDMFAQAGRTLRMPGRVNPLRGLRVKHVIADGESQSAFRMVTYVNAVEPVARAFDGFLVHSRNGTAAPLGEGFTGDVPAARIRTDLKVPVFQVLSESDLFGIGASFPAARQRDSKRVRTWEIAGTAHADGRYLRLLSVQGQREFPRMLDLTSVFDVANNGPQQYVMNAAVRALRAWVARGTPPPRAKPLKIVDGAIARDANGNALGGVRTPQLDVPVATLTGEGARLIGATTPFDDAKLASLYPTHQAYVTKFDRAAERAVERGFLLAVDARRMKQEAAASDIGGPAQDR
jgi:hypothetical protein